jgi:hypothetical protein
MFPECPLNIIYLYQVQELRELKGLPAQLKKAHDQWEDAEMEKAVLASKVQS